MQKRQHPYEHLHILGSALLLITSVDYGDLSGFLLSLDPLSKYGAIILALVVLDGFCSYFRSVACFLSARRNENSK